MADIIEFKPGTNKKSITVKREYEHECQHAHITINESLTCVECTDCGQFIDPMWFLIKMAKRESKIMNAIESNRQQLEKIKDKMRCKCQHCGKLTDIHKF